jgi:hypothetical protein
MSLHSRHLLLGALTVLPAFLSPSGPPAGRIRRVPAEHRTIQVAIDSAAPGDTVLVAPGRYLEYIRFHGKGIVVASEYLQTRDPAMIARTIIDGSRGAGGAVDFECRWGRNSLRVRGTDHPPQRDPRQPRRVRCRHGAVSIGSHRVEQPDHGQPRHRRDARLHGDAARREWWWAQVYAPVLLRNNLVWGNRQGPRADAGAYGGPAAAVLLP